jgi:hypothetical protein
VKGDCYSAAVETMKDLLADDQDYDHVFVVHGQPIGTGPENNGKRYNHAWVEVVLTVKVPDDAPDDFHHLDGMSIITVHDNSNDNSVVMPRDLYYHYGNIYYDEVTLYEWADVQENLAFYRHWGPWDESFPPYELEDLDD